MDHHRIALRVKVAIACCFAVAGLVPAQSGRHREATNSKRSTDEKDAFKLRAEEILLTVSVKGSNGKLPPTLTRDDFIVTEDGKKQQITAATRAPANVLFVVDVGGEINFRKDPALNREIVLHAIKGLGVEDKAAIITYGDKISLLSSWTSDKTALTEALKTKLVPGIKSDYYNCLLYAVKEVLPRVSGRRSVVLVSDGVDSFENNQFEEALDALHRARATAYVVSPNAVLIKELRERVFHPLALYEMIDPRVRKKYEPIRQYVRHLEAAEILLKGFAEETGGAIWNLRERPECEKRRSNPFEKPEYREKKETCETIAASLVDEIGTEFIVAYSSQRQPDDSSFHLVKIYSPRSDLRLRTRRGVYADAALKPPGKP